MDPATAPPPPPASPKAGSSKRPRKAALPLGDVTNLLPSTPAPRRRRRPLPPPSASTSTFSSASASAPAPVTPLSRTRPVAAAAEEERSLVKSAISTVYTSRKTKARRDPTAPTFRAATASCPPLGRSAGISSHSTQKALSTQDGRRISSSAPTHEVKKKRCTRMGTLSSGQLKLPEDFVKKQRAYFEEVDAFELPEEEASETDQD